MVSTFSVSVMVSRFSIRSSSGDGPYCCLICSRAGLVGEIVKLMRSKLSACWSSSILCAKLSISIVLNCSFPFCGWVQNNCNNNAKDSHEDLLVSLSVLRMVWFCSDSLSVGGVERYWLSLSLKCCLMLKWFLSFQYRYPWIYRWGILDLVYLIEHIVI